MFGPSRMVIRKYRFVCVCVFLSASCATWDRSNFNSHYFLTSTMWTIIQISKSLVNIKWDIRMCKIHEMNKYILYPIYINFIKIICSYFSKKLLVILDWEIMEAHKRGTTFQVVCKWWKGKREIDTGWWWSNFLRSSIYFSIWSFPKSNSLR